MPVAVFPDDPPGIEGWSDYHGGVDGPRARPSRRDGSRRSRRISIAAGLLMLLAAVTLAASLLHPAGHRASPAVRSSAPARAPSVQPRSPRAAFAGSAKSKPVDVRAIDATLAAELNGRQGHYGIEVIDLASGTVYGVHEQDSFQAASVNKLPILIALYQRAEAGQVNLGQTLTLTESDIQHYGTGTIQQPGSPRTYTLADLAGLMINVSDNSAAYVLERFIGQAAVQQDVRGWGLSHTSMADNTTTPADAAALLAAVYSDRLLAPAGSQSVLDLMKQTVFTDRLAAGMPAGIPVAHKIGTDAGIFNDAGIVLLPGRPYAVAVFSEDANQTEADSVYARINMDLLAFQRSLPSLPAP